jgi:hypothetical protein
MAATEATIISWTPANWITIVLMNALFWVVLITAWKLWKSKSQSNLPLAA